MMAVIRRHMDEGVGEAASEVAWTAREPCSLRLNSRGGFSRLVASDRGPSEGALGGLAPSLPKIGGLLFAKDEARFGPSPAVREGHATQRKESAPGTVRPAATGRALWTSLVRRPIRAQA
jgi:hypothetical protein